MNNDTETTNCYTIFDARPIKIIEDGNYLIAKRGDKLFAFCIEGKILIRHNGKLISLDEIIKQRSKNELNIEGPNYHLIPINKETKNQ